MKITIDTHINSQSKQQIVSPVRKRVFRCAKWSLIFFRCANNALFFCSSFFTRTSFNFEYRFSMSVATSLSWTNKLCPPGTLFIIWRSILSFSRIANPLSIRIGGWVASKFVRKSAERKEAWKMKAIISHDHTYAGAFACRQLWPEKKV